jgi:hypothetical protein
VALETMTACHNAAGEAEKQEFHKDGGEFTSLLSVRRRGVFLLSMT